MKAKNIILIHGWGASTEKLSPLANELKKKRWKVVVPELPGFGVPAPEYAWRLAEYSDYIIKIAKDNFHNENYYLFGHSFGGGVGLKTALKSPKRLKGLILCATRGFSRGNPYKRYSLMILAKTGKVLLVLSPLAYFWRKILYKLAREHDYEKAQGVMKDVFKKVVSEDLRPLVKNIKKPVLLLWGKEDRMTPVKDAFYIKKNLPGSKLILYPHVGHKLPYLKARDLAKEIAAFYDETEA